MTRKPRWQQEDPRFREESARYANPIPSREHLLAKLAEAKQPLAKLYHWRRAAAGEKAAPVVSTATPGFRAGMTISERGAISFSQDGSRLFFGVAPAPAPEREPAEADAAANDEKVLVDLWHWKDDYIQPMQKVRAEADRNRSYRAVWHLQEQKFVQLADAALESVTPSSSGLWALGSDDRAYRIFKGQNTGTSDHYLVNTIDGTRRLLLKEFPFNLSFSPNGKYAVFFDGKHWGSVSIPEGRFTNLTKSLPVNFWQEDHDSPSVAPSYGLAGWTKDDRAVLIYDQYDIWQIAPDGSAAKNLTDGLGRREKIELRYARLDPQEKFIDPAKPLLLRAENEWTRDSGFYRDRVDGGMPEKLLMAARSFSPPVKAKDADVLLLTASRFDEFPDLQVADPSFKSLRKVSDLGAQKNAYIWGKAELVRYKNVDGVPLSGILVKPENFDPTKKYPMIVYIYEKLSDGLHRFVNPSPGTSINASFYASNGYLVYMPDIVYTIGYPGQSALKCVLPAIQAVADQGFVNENAIGIQGHSWGGYQIAYMVTQTNRFKAAAPGALVAVSPGALAGARAGLHDTAPGRRHHVQGSRRPVRREGTQSSGCRPRLFPTAPGWQHGGPLGRRGRVLPGFASIRRSTSRSLRVVVFVVGILPHCRQLLEQLRQPFLHRLPHYIEVDLEIAVSHAIAHVAHAAPRHSGVRLCELDIAVHHLRGGLADDDEAHDDSLLGALVEQEVVLGQSFHEAARIGCGLLDVIEVVGQAVFTHTGCASASTLARNFGGRSPGVSKSTSTPSSNFSSSSRSPRSSNVAPGSASTSRSRSLPSRSVPCSTEPKTRGFAVRKRPTTSRTAFRFMSRTTDGRMGILSYRNSLRWNESLLSPRWSHSSRSRLTGAATSTPAARAHVAAAARGLGPSVNALS